MRTLALQFGGVLAGALLISAALRAGQDSTQAEPAVRDGNFVWFQLTETKAEVARMMGSPALVGAFGKDYRSWQFRINVADHDDFSHHFVFRESQNRLVSVTRTFDPEQEVAAMFPEGETTVLYYPEKKHPQYRFLLRRLPGGRILIAMGISDRRQPVAQLNMVLESELPTFHPWLAQQLMPPAASP